MSASEGPLPGSVPDDWFRRRLLFIAAAGLALRALAIVTIPTQPVSDFWGYFQRGKHLAESLRYEAHSGRPDASHPPLYPLLLAAASRVAPGHELVAAKAVNCLLGVAAIFITGVGTRRLWGVRAGLAAALLCAFFPRNLLMPCLVASENLFTPLLLLFVFLSIEAARRPRAASLAVAGGVCLGALALTRTVAYFMGPLWLVAALAGRKKLRHVLAGTLLLLAAEHVVMLPWAIRNELTLGRFTFLNTAGGYGLFLGNNPHATGLWYPGTDDLERFSPGVFSRGELAVSEASNRAAVQWIRANPGRALELYFKKIEIIFWQSYIVADFAISGTSIAPPVPGIDVLPGPHVLKEHILLTKRLLGAAAWLLVFLGIAGMVALVARARTTRSAADRAAALIFPLAAAYVPLTSALIAVNGRYRWPVEDLLIPATALALTAVRRAPNEARKRSSRASGVARFRLVPWEPIALACAAAIVVWQVFVPPVVGLADEGDFVKVMGAVGLRYRTETFAGPYHWLTLDYGVRAPWWDAYRTSESLLVRVARSLSIGFVRRSDFDLRVLGALHALLFLAGLALLLAAARRLPHAARVAFAALLVFVFTDVGYVGYFNSLYGAAASLVFLLLLAGIVFALARGSRSKVLQALFWPAAVLFVTSKPQESLQAVPIALLAVGLARQNRGPGTRRSATVLAAVLLAGSVVYYLRAPLQFKTEALYNNVFQELIWHPSAPRDFAELGLPASWLAYRGTHAYTPAGPLTNPAFRSDFLSRVGYRKLGAFYLRHPGRAFERLARGARAAFSIRPGYLGNFVRESGARPGEKSRAFAAWSGLKAKLADAPIWILPILWLVNLAGAAAILVRSADERRRACALAVAALTLMGILEYVVCCFGDSQADLARHLHAFNAMTDLVLIADVTWLAALLSRHRQAFLKAVRQR